MREGFIQDANKIEDTRRRRRGPEVIDEDEAPQVVIAEKFKGQIDDDEARAYVVEKGDKSKEGSKDTKLPVKPKPENVTLGMRKTKKLNEGVKRTVDEDEDLTTKSEKLRKSAPRKEKKLKLSFEDE